MLPCYLSSPDQPHEYREIPIVSSGGDRDIAPVSSPARAYDGNPSTHAGFDSASWQQHKFSFDGVHVVDHVTVRYSNNEGSGLRFQVGGKAFTPAGDMNEKRLDVAQPDNGIYISDSTGGRNRLFELKAFGRYVVHG